MARSLSHIPDHKIDEVRLAADIVQVVGQRVRLTKKGKDWWGLCPFHGDKDPSFKVDRERGTWYCFGCGEGGSVFNFLMKDEGLSFPEAVRELAQRFGVELPKPRLNPQEQEAERQRQALYGVLTKAQEYFRRCLASPAGGAARDYLARRGLEPEAIDRFGLGFAPDQWEGLRRHLASQGVDQDQAVAAGLLVPRDRGPGAYDRFRGRVTVPIRDLKGRVISFGGRILGDGEPKYLNGPESPLFNKSATLFNLDRARKAMRKRDRALLVEGYFDAIICAVFGFEETVAPMGTALTARQVRLLSRQASETILVFDGDQAGRRAARRALPLFLAEQAPVKVLHLPAGEDPDSFLRNQGPQAFEELLQQARPLTEMVLEEIVAAGDLSTPEGRSKVAAQAGEVLKAIKDPVASWLYLERLAGSLGLPPAVLAQRLGMPLPRRGGAAAPAARPARRSDCLVWDNERCILELALCSPAACRVLAQGGALQGMSDPRLQAVAQAILAVLERGADPRPDAVTLALEDQSLAGLVSGLAQCDLRLDDQEAVQQAHSVLARLGAKLKEKRRRQLNRDIEAAYRRGDLARVAELQKERQRINQSYSPPQAGKD